MTSTSKEREVSRVILDFNAGPIPEGPAELIGYAGDVPIYCGGQPYDHADNDSFEGPQHP